MAAAGPLASRHPTRRGLAGLLAATTTEAPAGHPLLPALAALRLGANLERWFPVARDNRPRRLGRPWWREFRAAGFDHARLFIPDAGQAGAGPEIAARFAAAAQDAVAEGLIVLLGLADTWYETSPWDAQDWTALRTRGALLAAETDPDRVVLSPLNEPAFATTAAWLPVRDRLLGTLRAIAPRHVIAWGGREWCSARSLAEAPPPADPWTIAEVHDYEGGDGAARFGALARWRARHGRTVLVTELGGAKGNETNPPAWAADLARKLPVLAALHLPAALWAFTHGSWWRLQEGDAPYPRRGLLPPGPGG